MHETVEAPAPAPALAWMPARPGLGTPAWAIALLALLGLVPLLLTPVLPLTDFYAHVARYHILAQIGDDPALAEYYNAAWRLLPNLGLDLLGTALMLALPPLLVAKLLAVLMLAAPFLGVLALARVLHGHIPPMTVALAGILAYSHILVWGFANFLLGLGIGLGGLALWIALAPRPRWQLGTGLALALVLFFVHGLAFALWGLLLGCVELMRAAEDGDLRRPVSLARRMARLAALAILPVVLFLQMPTSEADGGVTGAFDNLARYATQNELGPRLTVELWDRTDNVLRVADSGLPLLDICLGTVLWGVLAAGFLSGALRLDRRLWLAAGLAFVLIGVMPPNLFGVGYLDDRMPLVLLALLAAGMTPARVPVFGRLDMRGAVCVGLVALLALRLGVVGAVWARDGQVYRGFLDTLAQQGSGEMGAPAYFDGTGHRDSAITSCKPLAFLMLLENGTAVPTFAHATQQPLQLAGSLAQAQASASPGPLRTDLYALDRMTPPEEARAVLADLSRHGFDTVVACWRGAPPPPPEGMALVAHEAPWALYRRVEE